MSGVQCVHRKSGRGKNALDKSIHFLSTYPGFSYRSQIAIK